ncbi:C-type single domain activation associated secreted protein ASP3 [Trichostrongylus colubriformis]|uniref:C-type single domain activation associated secreted protein ASP3 n=1 Tax=Trichostrongylus colubriformis TaxID=6319 RepID=A0AAN8J2B5_TRICO
MDNKSTSNSTTTYGPTFISPSTGFCVDDEREDTLLCTPAWAAWAGSCPKWKGMSDDVRWAFVNKHNEYRSLVAKGNAPNPRYGGFAPKAARMFKVSYDCDIEKNMMAWIEKCQWGHSPRSARQGLGENLWMISLPDYDKWESAVNATGSWFDELRQFGVPVDNVFSVDVSRKGVGHYTQLVSQRSDRIGCAVKSCPGMTYAGCQYKEPGNFINSYIYETDTCIAKPIFQVNAIQDDSNGNSTLSR